MRLILGVWELPVCRFLRGPGRWDGVEGSAAEWDRLDRGAHVLPGLFPWPAGRQVQGESPCRAGEPARDVDELRSDGACGGAGVERRRERAGGAGQVERDRGANQPGAVGPKLTRRQVRQWPVLQIGDDLFDDRVTTV